MQTEKNTGAGLLSGILAFLLWGILPLYWKALGLLPANMILCHRIIWSCALMLVVVSISGRWGEIGRAHV